MQLPSTAMRTLISLVFLSLSTALAVPFLHHVVHEKRAMDPIDWEVAGRANAHTTLPLRIGLKQQNIENIEFLNI